MSSKLVAPAYEALQKALPYKIVPTSLPGVYTSPLPPADLDRDKADARTLAKHGVLLRRPGAQDRTKVQAAWERVAARKWQQIVPKMEVQFGKTHRIRNLKKTEDGYTNAAWAGGVLNGPPGQYAGVTGSWAVPTVGTPSEPAGAGGGWDSSSWIGIDGFGTGSTDVLQAGIQQSVDGSGNPSYVAWYEWFVPDGDSTLFPYINQVNIGGFSVNPGDTIVCAVKYAGTFGQLSLANDTTGETPSIITLVPPTGASFNGSCAEWIMEAPSGGEPTSSLPSFSPVVFTSAFACNNDGSVVANPENGDYVNILGANNQLLTSVTLGDDEVTIDFIG